MLNALLKPFAVPIIAALLATNGLLGFGYWQRGKTLESKTAEIATLNQSLVTCNAGLSLQNEAIARLKKAADMQVAKAQQAARVAAQIKAQGQTAIVRAQAVQLTGQCVQDMETLAKEFTQ